MKGVLLERQEERSITEPFMTVPLCAPSLTPRLRTLPTAWDSKVALEEGGMCLLHVHHDSIHPFLCCELNTLATLWQRFSVTFISRAGHA